MFTVFTTQNLEDLTVLDTGSRDYVAFSFSISMLKGIYMRYCHISYVHSRILDWWAGHSWIATAEYFAYKGLGKVSVLGKGRSSDQTWQNTHEFELIFVLFCLFPE